MFKQLMNISSAVQGSSGKLGLDRLRVDTKIYAMSSGGNDRKRPGQSDPQGSTKRSAGQGVESRERPEPPVKPTLPTFDAAHAFGALGNAWIKPSLTAHLDVIRQAAPLGVAPPGETAAELLLRYLRGLPNGQNNSQLLYAEMVYLHFAGEQCPLLYESQTDSWCVYDKYWKRTKGSLARVRVYLQTGFLACLREVVQQALAQGCFPPQPDGEDHLRMEFLKKLIGSVENRDGVEKTIKEACMFFNKEVEFDVNPDILQLQNAVVDLIANKIRHCRPSDMCSRASPIEIPTAWLDDSSIIPAQSVQQRQEAWDVIWSMFKRDGDFHVLDHFDDIGDQDVTNFNFMMKVLARLLEGRPLCMLVVLTNPRGRNSKGVVEKILIALMGDYFVPVRSTIFQTERRNENEHSAAETNRRGARVAFGNEVLTAPWSNAVFKSRNSSDPINARGCGSKDVERITRTETFVYGMNDPPEWEATPKGSEEDRLLILYTPNKYINAGVAPSSPRTFVKDLTLEDRVGRPEFALGLLLNLLQVRKEVADAGQGLGTIIGGGTATSRLWLQRWMDHWTKGDPMVHAASRVRGDECDEFVKSQLDDIHRRYQGKQEILECAINEDKEIGGTKTTRWSNVLRLLDQGGRYADTLFTRGVGMSRKKVSQGTLRVHTLDLVAYEALFGDVGVFDSIEGYSYPTKNEIVTDGMVADDAEIHNTERNYTKLYQTTDVHNLHALERRQAVGVDVSGERRPDELEKFINILKAKGAPVEIVNGELKDTDTSDYWKIRRDHVQIDGIGRALQAGGGTQTTTKETRADGYEGMVVGEIDLISAFFQILLLDVRGITSGSQLEAEFGTFLKYEKNPRAWRDQQAEYYTIGKDESQTIFVRMPCGGSLRPDAEWEAARTDDLLPCMLQLRYEVRKAHSLIAEKSERYKTISELPRVLTSDRPEMWRGVSFVASQAFCIDYFRRRIWRITCFYVRSVTPSIAPPPCQPLPYI